VMFTTEERTEIELTKQKIKTIVYLKLNDFDKELKDLLFNNCIVTGGISASLIHNEKYNDVDMYFKTYDAINEFHTYMKDNNIWDSVKDCDPNYEMSNGTVANKVVTNNAYTFKNEMQTIVMAPFEQAHKEFDFYHTLPYYDISADKYYISKNQYECIKSKKLLPINIILAKQKRVDKFVERGWVLSYD
jgi:hypothetical protein